MKQLTEREQNMVTLATNIVEERGGRVTRVEVKDLNNEGVAVQKRTRYTYRDITLYGYGSSDRETIQAKIFPDAGHKENQFEIYTQVKATAEQKRVIQKYDGKGHQVLWSTISDEGIIKLQVAHVGRSLMDGQKYWNKMEILQVQPDGEVEVLEEKYPE
jgi:hypothetical protein